MLPLQPETFPSCLALEEPGGLPTVYLSIHFADIDTHQSLVHGASIYRRAGFEVGGGNTEVTVEEEEMRVTEEEKQWSSGICQSATTPRSCA